MMSPFGMASLFYLFGGAIASYILIAFFIYILPLIQALISSQRESWLVQHFANTPSANAEEDAVRARLLAAAKPERQHPIYKLLKFGLIASGIFCIIFGIIYIALPEEQTDNGRKIVSIIPLLVGLGVYFLHKNILKNDGLWRELAGLFLLAGTAASMFAWYDLFELGEYISSDIYLYVILGLGLFVMHHLNSVVASYVYIVLIIIGSEFVNSNIGNNWMVFMSHFIWFFAAGILSFWLPRLRAAKKIEMGDVIFGILFFSMVITLAMNNTSGLTALALAVFLPALYLFSKIHFKNATWFGARPIEFFVLFSIIGVAIALSFEDFVVLTQNKINLIHNFSFHKLVAFFIIGITGLIAYFMYDDQNDKEKKAMNLWILLGPLCAFLLVYALGKYGTHYLACLFILGLGVDFIMKGLKQKNVSYLFTGTLSIIIGIAERVYEYREQLDDKIGTGIVVFFFGCVFLSLGMYLRSVWTVTNSNPLNTGGHKDQTLS